MAAAGRRRHRGGSAADQRAGHAVPRRTAGAAPEPRRRGAERRGIGSRLLPGEAAAASEWAMLPEGVKGGDCGPGSGE